MEVLKTYVMPVVVSVVASWLAGFLWFRVLFRIPDSDALSASTVSTLQHVGDVGFACLIAWVMFRTGMHTVLEGVLLGIAVWATFTLAVAGHMYAFRSFTFRFFATTAGSVLFSLLVIGTILGAIIQNDI